MSTPFTSDKVMGGRGADLTGFYGEIDKKKNDRLRRSSSRIASKLHEEEDEVEEKQAEAGENRQERVLTGNDIDAEHGGGGQGRVSRPQKVQSTQSGDTPSTPRSCPFLGKT